MERQSLPTEVISAQTSRTGFLHLPNEIRNRIYGLVLFQHDRGAVFLPRKLPRKVLDDGSKIRDVFKDPESRHPTACILTSDIALREMSWEVDEDSSWVAEERPPEEIPLPIFTEDWTDDEREIYTSVPESYDMWKKSWLQTREFAKTREGGTEAADMCSDCQLVYCNCTVEALPSALEAHDAIVEAQDLNNNDDDQIDETLEDQPVEEQHAPDHTPDDAPHDTRADRNNPAPNDTQPNDPAPKDLESEDDDSDEVEPYDSSEDEEAYVDDELDDEPDDDPLEEDDEHFDSEERIGMLFRTSEPGILLACKEIREQCMPVYYGSNAFSWRFFWGHQTKSLARFTKWTTVVGKYAKYITKISFEGRHDIEEGIEFEVDIDLFKQPPFFDVAADCIHTGDELTDVIVEAIEQDFITVLWRMSKRDRGQIKLSSKDLCLLGTIFSEMLERDPGVVGDRGDYDGKHISILRGA